MNTNWSKKNAVDVDTTHVESVLDSQTHSCINLSTSDKIDELIKSLNRIHTQLDDTIKRRTQQISAETESVLSHIINETQAEQQRLLTYAKGQQKIQDQHYRGLLENYIAQLDEMKARDFTDLQNELQDCREQILHISQMKIMSVNDQANIMKSKIVKEEQQQATSKIDAINVQLQSLSTDQDFQQLGSEMVTKTSVTTSTNVGRKADGQFCTFNFAEDAPNSKENNKNNTEHSQQIPKKTTNSDLKNEHHQTNSREGTPKEKRSPTTSKSPAQGSH